MQAILLGTAQDGGVPHAGCYCARCVRAREEVTHRHYVVSLGLIDPTSHAFWLIDATPDFCEQIHYLHEILPGYTLKGIFLTHGHIGHYPGLMYVGKEVMNLQSLPVFGTESMCNFLLNNGPWSLLVKNGNISLQTLSPEQMFPLAEITITAVSVPHRGEFTDTVAYAMRGKYRSLFYCPDIDRWEQWNYDIREVVDRTDIALLDASFFSNTELPGRDMSKIPHPLVTDTAARLEGTTSQVYFIHLNHTNPLLDDSSAQHSWVRERKFNIGKLGMIWEL
jgi:pyrroloquinoline quinone biosynthesis protein B